MRRSRENRAMAGRTAFGRQMIAGQWAAAEFAALARLWEIGAGHDRIAVPYPVQLLGTELMLEFVGDAESGTAAPRLAQLRPDPDRAAPTCGASWSRRCGCWPGPATRTATCRRTTCWCTRAGWS